MEDCTISRRERKKQKTTANILSAARHLFEEKGYENVSIEDITERADVSKSTFFNHFSSKESLISGIAEDEVEDVIYFIQDELENVNDFSEKIRMILNRIIEDSDPYLYLTGRLISSSIINANSSPSPFYRINLAIEAIVREGQHNGIYINSASAEDMATLILGSLYGVIFKRLGTGGCNNLKSEINSIIDIVLRGITLS